MHKSGKGHICFSNNTLSVWVQKKKGKYKTLKKEKALRDRLLFSFLSLDHVNILVIQSLFSPRLTPDEKWWIKSPLRKAVVPGHRLCLPAPAATEQAETQGPHHKGVHMPKERSPLESEPSGLCEKQSLSAVLSRSLSSPCLLFPLVTILSQF